MLRECTLCTTLDLKGSEPRAISMHFVHSYKVAALESCSLLQAKRGPVIQKGGTHNSSRPNRPAPFFYMALLRSSSSRMQEGRQRVPKIPRTAPSLKPQKTLNPKADSKAHTVLPGCLGRWHFPRALRCTQDKGRDVPPPYGKQGCKTSVSLH